MTRLRILTVLAAPMLFAACASPAYVVNRQSAEMTPAQIAEMGLVCRKNMPAGSRIPNSICASEENWEAMDAKDRDLTDRNLATNERQTDNRVLYPR